MNKQNSDYKKYIGERIKLARKSAHLTQAELAEEIAVCTEHISKIERGVTYHSMDTMINICYALNITPNFLLKDLINDNSDDLKYQLDKDFVINYLKLNPHDKETIHMLTKDLVKQQEKKTSTTKK